MDKPRRAALKDRVAGPFVLGQECIELGHCRKRSRPNRMSHGTDPFRHHPGLRDLITPPAQSQLRNLTLARILQMVQDNGGDTTLFLTEEDREADRAAHMAGRWDQDLWVFAYGSLIWDPAFDFAEIRRAHAPHAARRFILRDIGGGRGSKDRPGVMAALDQGDGCDGVVFRIRATDLPDETYRIWLRERVGHAYQPAFIPVTTAHGNVEALTFLADHSAPFIKADMSYAEQVRYCATGKGFLGTSLAYVENLAAHFDALGIHDAALLQLRDDARAYQLQGGVA